MNYKFLALLYNFTVFVFRTYVYNVHGQFLGRKKSLKRTESPLIATLRAFVFFLLTLVPIMSDFYRWQWDKICGFSDSNIIRNVLFITINRYIEFFSVICVRHSNKANNQFKLAFWLNIIKKFPIDAISLLIRAYFDIYFMRLFSPKIMFAWYGVLLYFVIQAFVWEANNVVIYPDLVFKKEPMKECDLKTEIQDFLQDNKYPVDKIFVTSQPPFCPTVNDITLYSADDTAELTMRTKLLEKCTKEQVLALVAHEVGIWNQRIMAIQYSSCSVFLFTVVSLLRHLRGNSQLNQDFEVPRECIGLGVFVCFLFLSPLEEMGVLSYKWINGYMDMKADEFAASKGFKRHLIDALRITADYEMIPVNGLVGLFYSCGVSLTRLERLEAIPDPVEQGVQQEWDSIGDKGSRRMSFNLKHNIEISST